MIDFKFNKSGDTLYISTYTQIYLAKFINIATEFGINDKKEIIETTAASSSFTIVQTVTINSSISNEFNISCFNFSTTDNALFFYVIRMVIILLL